MRGRKWRGICRTSVQVLPTRLCKVDVVARRWNLALCVCVLVGVVGR